MIYFTVVFFCTAGLFLTLLEDRFRMWTTIGVSVITYISALLVAFALRRAIQNPVLAQQLPCAAGSLLFLASSIFLYTNNFLQKLFVALLSLCNFSFISFFVPLFLGKLPFSAAGAFGGVFSVAAYLLFTLLVGLCLYRPFGHFAARGVSGFIVGMCLLLLVLYTLSVGRLDFLFRTNIPAARLLSVTALYAAIVFAFRSLYHAGKFSEAAAQETATAHMLQLESSIASDTLAAVREARSAQKAGEYALDTVKVMLADGNADEVPTYADAAKNAASQLPILTVYHDNPYISAVIAARAAFSAQNEIDFECNAVTGELNIDTAELCIIINELLARACRDAAEFNGSRRVRFTAFPDDGSLKLEAVYSATLPENDRFTLKGKKLSQVFAWLFDDNPTEVNIMRGLECTEEIIERHSGRLTVAAAGNDEVILQAVLKF